MHTTTEHEVLAALDFEISDVDFGIEEVGEAVLPSFWEAVGVVVGAAAGIAAGYGAVVLLAT
jgi:hypothetical protein